MSETVRKVASATIVMWMIAVLILPVVGYVASLALQMPKVVAQLTHIAETNKEVAIELRALKQTNIEEHQLIMQKMNSNHYVIGSIRSDCDENTENIKWCKSKYWQGAIRTISQ